MSSEIAFLLGMIIMMPVSIVSYYYGKREGWQDGWYEGRKTEIGHSTEMIRLVSCALKEFKG